MVDSNAYRLAREQVVVFDRSDRGLVQVTGKDRKTWLHNLVTNAITTLDENAGNYAFACDLRGRVLFDLNVLSLADALWLDIDSARLPAALAHLNKYLIMEDAKLDDLSSASARLGVSGPLAGQVAASLGVTNFASLPSLASVRLATPGGIAGDVDDKLKQARLVRHDFAGAAAFEIILPRGQAAGWWTLLTRELNVAPAEMQTLDVLRIEAGIPWPRDFEQRTIPPETGQIERGISYHKGCYLGQEIIERMRSHGTQARRLVRVSLADGEGLTLPSQLTKDGKEVGRITSLVPHPLERKWIGLGYLRTSVADVAGLSTGQPPRSVCVP